MATLLSWLVCVAIVTLTCAASLKKETKVAKRQYNYGCYVNGYNYKHGEIFSLPSHSICLKYRCYNGGWSIVEEGCEMEHRCHAVGSVFEYDCITYRCTKSNRGNSFLYKTERVSALCQDYNGVCRYQGEQFPYVLRGKLYKNCYCQISNNGGSIAYTCTF